MEKPVIPSSKPKSPRLIGLDLLRLVAIVLVLGRHMELPAADWPEGWKWFLLTWHRGGWIGVDLFFVLSGFLISGLLFGEYKQRRVLSLRRFYTRRWWKIYPPFLALIVITVAVKLAYDPPIDWKAFFAEIFFVQNYIPGLWGYTWSLAVEEHFYLLLPFTLFFLHQRRNKMSEPLSPILVIAAVIAIVALILRVINAYYQPIYSHMAHLFPSHLRIDSLFFGVVISYFYHFHTDRFMQICYPIRKWLIVSGMIFLAPAFIFPIEETPFIYTLGFTIFYIGSGMLVVGVLLSSIPNTRLVRLLGGMGGYSYSIYLWHTPMILWGVPLVDGLLLGGGLGYGVRTVTYMIGSLLLGIFMSRLVEVPALRLRERWFPSSTKGPIV